MAYADSKWPAGAGDDTRVPDGFDNVHDDSSKGGAHERGARIIPEAIAMLAAAAGLFAAIVGVFLVV